MSKPRAKIGAGISAFYIDPFYPEPEGPVEDEPVNTNTDLQNGTPFSDVLEGAEYILKETLAEEGGTFIYDVAIPALGLKAGWNKYEGDGYAVGGYRPTVRTEVSAAQPTVIADYIQRLPRKASGEYHYLVGTWIEDGVLYLDAVQVWADRGVAVEEARNLNQKAIYDLSNGETLYLHVREDEVGQEEAQPEVEWVSDDKSLIVGVRHQGQVFVSKTAIERYLRTRIRTLREQQGLNNELGYYEAAHAIGQQATILEDAIYGLPRLFNN